jgi:mRNA interferase HigB
MGALYETRRHQRGVPVKVISRRALVAFWERRDSRVAEAPLRSWFKEAEGARWSSPAAVKACYASASVLKNGRVVFNIGGNKFRLVVKINYAVGVVFVRFVGTHAEYDRIDVESV